MSEEVRDPRQLREDAVSQIAAREHAQIIADNVRAKLERYIELEIFSTEKNDHTASLSERVAILERELGEIRELYFDRNRLAERLDRLEGEGFRRRLRRWWRGSFP